MKRRKRPSKGVLAVEQALAELGMALEVSCTDGTVTRYGFKRGKMVRKAEWKRKRQRR